MVTARCAGDRRALKYWTMMMIGRATRAATRRVAGQICASWGWRGDYARPQWPQEAHLLAARCPLARSLARRAAGRCVRLPHSLARRRLRRARAFVFVDRAYKQCARILLWGLKGGGVEGRRVDGWVTAGRYRSSTLSSPSWLSRVDMMMRTTPRSVVFII